MDTPRWHNIPWIFFDLDDTIWNFSANSAISLRKLYEISPILRKLFKSVEEFIDIYHVNNALMWDYYSKGMVTTAQLKLERWRRTLATRQFEVLTAVCEELERNYLDILAEGKEMIPGVREMLERLSKKYMLAILSNGFSKTQYKKLSFSGLDKYITRTIVSEEIGINKPNPELFQYAVNETGAQSPLLMVGDHGETDVYGAMKAGWFAIWVNPEDKPFPISKEIMERDEVDPQLFVASVKNMYELEKVILDFFNQENSSLKF